ncbi:glycosyltransferase family 4 protein [Caballeronia sp. LZ001]|uniref:glycosyltransferase family 4 protein n=1 Tax=Caballeronia sp. LZ001 TaxID=3038553 RepID=UPI00286523DF|nr:glycosyltransferase family 4 protein [Caballeronia sp. LZ001]MDR5804597.1 glycosyltransferase family 4 protein [Caballeronia sp. LZ001]
MKITLLVSSMGSGGAERVAATLVNAWSERGDDVTLIATYSGKGDCFYKISENVRFIYLTDRAGSQGGKLSSFVQRQRALRSLIRENRPDVVISFLTNVNVAAILATLGLGIPVIACEHNDPSRDGRSALWKLLTRLTYPHASAITVLTENVVAPFKTMVPGMRHIAVVPNPLPDELFQQSAPSIETGAHMRLVSLGRLHPQKNYRLLIDAFSSIANACPEWDLWIWGEGAERASLEAEIERRGMTQRIFLPGVTENPWTEILRSQAFVMSSRFEGFGLALAESMALGVPAVAVDCLSGPRYITRDGQDALLVPVANPQALAAAIQRMLTDDTLRAELSRKGAKSVRERYSTNTILRVWDELFTRVGVDTDDAAARRPIHENDMTDYDSHELQGAYDSTRR